MIVKIRFNWCLLYSMKFKIKKIIFLFLFVYSAFFFAGSSLAPIMAGMGQYEFSAKLTSLYMYSCHQQPDRSFWILGYPVSLCCRCYGVYFSTMICSLFVFLDKFKIKKLILLLIIFVSLADLFFNFVIGYNTGNITRFIMGIFMGIIIVAFINKIFSSKGGNNCEV